MKPNGTEEHEGGHHIGNAVRQARVLAPPISTPKIPRPTPIMAPMFGVKLGNAPLPDPSNGTYDVVGCPAPSPPVPPPVRLAPFGCSKKYKVHQSCGRARI